MIAETPLVTVLVPTYARAGMLAQAICSALEQTYRNLEILVLDDCSPDDTPATVAGFAADARLRSLRHERNLGIAGNWRAGIGAARGEFFCILHDDDTLEPRFIETLLAPLLADPSLALSFCEHWTTDAQGRRLDDDAHVERFRRGDLAEGPLRGEALERAVLFDHSIPVGGSLFRRAAVRSDFIDEHAKGAIDYWLLYRLLQTGGGAYFIRERLMNYRVHPGGMSSGSAAYMAEGHLFRLGEMLADPALTAHYAELAAARRAVRTDYGLALLRLGRRAEARHALAAALAERPSLRALAAFVLSCGGAAGGWLLGRLRALRG